MEIVGKVDPAEVEVIRDLHGRKTALKEMVFALATMSPEEMSPLYERVVRDLAETCLAFDRWWFEQGEAKQWPPGKKEINFRTGEIFTRETAPQ